MEFTLDTRLPAEIVIGASGVIEILQNVRTILGTIRGTVPLDRTFGLPGTFLDSPTPEAMATYTGEVVDEVERQEPRCIVVRIVFQPLTADAMDGRLYPVVTVDIEEDDD